MKLSQDAIREYQEVIFVEYGLKISEKEAEMQGQNLLIFLQTILNENGESKC